jgi:hypothetical protein
MIFLTRALLGGINDLSPSLRLGDEGIDSILLTLQGLRDRVLSMFILPCLHIPVPDVRSHPASMPRHYAYGDLDTFPST